MIHWPGFITNGWCNDAFVKGLADCQQQGLTQAIGVSNFKLERVKTAQQILKVSSGAATLLLDVVRRVAGVRAA